MCICRYQSLDLKLHVLPAKQQPTRNDSCAICGVVLIGRCCTCVHFAGQLFHARARLFSKQQLIFTALQAWLLAPAGIVSKWGKTLLGQRAARMLSRLHCGVEGVPSSCYPPQWVEVTPAGLVMDDRLGTSLWQVVEQSLQCTEAVSAVKAL